MTTPKLLLIDGHSLAFRSYFAFSKGRDGGLRTSTGIPTSVCFGFVKALLEAVEMENPDHIAIAFDLGGPTFRHTADATYKANRPETPQDFIPDLNNLREFLTAMNLPIVIAEGYEADDVIGTLARQACQQQWSVRILSGDRDLFQLVDDHEYVKILYTGSAFTKGTPREFGIQEVKEKLNVFPNQVVDFKALCGDTSDNIPGVKGIGEKTAAQLLETYGTLEKVYESIEDLKGAVKKRLEDGKESALHSQWLAQIHLGVPIEVTPNDCQFLPFEQSAIEPWIEKLEFRAFTGKLEALRCRLSGEAPAKISSTKNNKAVIPSESGDTWFFSPEDTAKSQQNIQQGADSPIAPQIITTPEQLHELVDILLACKDADRPVAWDTETTSLEPRDAKLVGIGCCWQAGSDHLAYIPLGHQAGQQMDTGAVLDTLRPILESDAYPKVLQNAKYDRLVFQHQGINLAGVVFDTMLASYVLNPDAKHNLSELGIQHLGIISQSYGDLVPKGKTIADLDISSVAQYCGMDVYVTFHLVEILRPKLKTSPTLWNLFTQVEVPLEPVLAAMETWGIRVDADYLNTFSKDLEQDLNRLEEQAYAAAGSTFNMGSPKQLSELLFTTLQLDTKKSKKTKTGFSTDASVLEKLQGDHPVVDAIVEHRTISKLKSTYVDKLPLLLRPETGRVHTDFNQAVTATGRLSSSEPNLQNIPIRTAFSRQIRKAFLPKENWLLAGADYSQIELRILAHLSQEPTLLKAYRNNEDVHRLTATIMLEKEEISSEERRLAKIINFGVIYGMGAARFAREAGVSNKEAKGFIDRFNARYPKVFSYLQQMQREAIARGYVETIQGRRRYFNFSSDSLRQLRGSDPDSIDLSAIKLRDQFDAQMLRAAANAPIQGSSADIIKLAMIAIAPKLDPEEARLLLQVHDELVFEVRPDAWNRLQRLIKTTMEEAVTLDIPLLVEIHAGKNWMEAK